jgi:hypothetical protein
MCPACIASAAWVAVGVTSTGSLTALAAKLLHSRQNAERISSEKEKAKEK